MESQSTVIGYGVEVDAPGGEVGGARRAGDRDRGPPDMFGGGERLGIQRGGVDRLARKWFESRTVSIAALGPPAGATASAAIGDEVGLASPNAQHAAAAVYRMAPIWAAGRAGDVGVLAVADGGGKLVEVLTS
jgi:hypothetical protein